MPWEIRLASLAIPYRKRRNNNRGEILYFFIQISINSLTKLAKSGKIFQYMFDRTYTHIVSK